MSAHKFSLVFSVRAQRDVDNILAYTLEQWGERQAIIYGEKINRVLECIIEDPCKCRANGNLRSVLAEKHKIFYRIEGETVFVVRILHQRMDEGRHLS